MEQFNMQVMLKDGTFADYDVKTDRKAQYYEVYDKETLIATFKDDKNGSFAIDTNTTNIEEDLQSRIAEQLKGFSV
ncbi:hypothetical protein ADIARSV_0299 [Arcticibacter svalbardensis MN12-7]|uniref:Uncharacterized protein n=1 Tax=Arcticibacter svalbardensis MN12-7 TaxID=1150600 RepID=R9GYD5_9SPHI|nr:hypothetical protein [Arcticibacter svalbardensis]EOR96515.1 hypothetical protein ADIARSV_0299 [Arcticibacter svalbardensis MN12-7]